MTAHNERTPQFVRLEYWNAKKGEWEVGHNGINLLDPTLYMSKLMKNKRVIARVRYVDTGEYEYSEGAELL